MALRLQIISDHARLLGEHATVVFGPRGGRIGRAPDNEWALPDPSRFLSAYHATIHGTDDAFEIEDTSRNGIYANGSDQPIGRGQRQRLKDGDVLRFGEYRIRVHIDPIEVHGSLSEALVAVDRVEPVRRSGESLPRPASVAPAQPGNAAASVDPEGSSLLFMALDMRSGLQAFCRGAGIEIDQLPQGSDLRVLLLAGQLLRESMLGLQLWIRAQREFQRQLGTPVPVTSVAGPTPDSASPADYLATLLNGELSGELDAVQVLRAFFDAGQRHETVLPTTLRIALLAFLNNLDPAVLEERAKARGDVEQAWSLYVELFRNIRQTARGDLPRLYSEALAQAYGKPS